MMQISEFTNMPICLKKAAGLWELFQRAFGELVKDSKARNIDDDKGRRRSQFVHYKENSGKGEKLVKIKL